jgi:glutamate synthase (NADPH/NADH) large chain
MTGGRVVILGPTGRNFAAGMSGGIAYVYDPAMMLERRLNPESVALEALDGEDLEFLAELIGRHHELTGSTLAGKLAAGGEETLAHFAKVVPVDYRRVLEAIKRAGELGTSVDDAIMAAAHG